ncbi:hypothetical protein [Roseixanthobacter pseudopolyaromaticivorans]|uniref:hypothetical protein n=1 Tax=Xanthobacteraceae TaxID=335928 RepID=UPI003728B663
MNIAYNPRDWYWKRLDETIYSSARQTYVAADDEAYLAWVAAGGHATAYPEDEAGAESEAELAAVLAPYGIRVHPGPLVEDVIAERDRRLSLGFDYDFGDARGEHHFGTTAEDMKGWNVVTQLAQALVSTGDASGTIHILTATGEADVTGIEWMSVLRAAGEFQQPIWQASFVLQATSPIPDDYADDIHW